MRGPYNAGGPPPLTTLDGPYPIGTGIVIPGGGGTYPGGTNLLTNLSGYWRLNEASGANNAVDASSNGRTLTQTGSPGSQSGILGNARTFNSSIPQYFSRPNEVGISAAADFTCTLWINISDKTDDWRCVSKDGEFGLYWSVGNGRMSLRIFDSSLASVEIVNNHGASPTIGTWYFMAVKVSGTTASVSQNGGTFDTGSIAGLGVRGSVFDYFVGGEQGGPYWNGALQAVGFWKRALSNTEVTSLYNGGSGRDPVLNP